MTAARTFLGSTIGKKVVMAVHGRRPGRLRARPHGRQPPALSRRRGHGRVRASSCASSCTAAACGSRAPCCSPAPCLHVWAARVAHAGRPRGASGAGIASGRPRESTCASRTMRWSGVVILAFIVYHLLDLTFGAVNPAFVEGRRLPQRRRELPRACRCRSSTSSRWCSCGSHLRHGVWSMLRTLGLSHPRYEALAAPRWPRSSPPWWWLGNISFPLAVLFGVVEVSRRSPAHASSRERPVAARSSRSGRSTAST